MSRDFVLRHAIADAENFINVAGRELRGEQARVGTSREQDTNESVKAIKVWLNQLDESP